MGSLADLELRLTMPHPRSFQGTRFERLPRSEIAVGVSGAYFNGMHVLGRFYATETHHKPSFLGARPTTRQLFNVSLVVAGPGASPIVDRISADTDTDRHVSAAIETIRAHYQREYERLHAEPVQPMPAYHPTSGGGG